MTCLSEKVLEERAGDRVVWWPDHPQIFDAGSPGATVYSLWDPGHFINLFGSSVFTSVKWVSYSLPHRDFCGG